MKTKKIFMLLLALMSVTGAWAQSVSFEHNDWRAQQYDYDFTTTSFYDMFVPTNVSHYYDCNSDWLKNGVANYSGELPEGTDNYQLFLSRMNTDWMAASLFDWFTMTAVTPAYTQYTYTIHFKVKCTQQLVTNTIVRAALFDYHGGSNAWLGRLSTPDKYNYFYTAQNDVTSQDQVLGDEICAARMVGTTEPYESTCDVSFTRKSNYGGTLTSVHCFGFSSSRSLGPKSSRCAHRTFLYACVTPHFDGYVKHVVYQPNAGTESEYTNDIISSGSIQSNQFTRTGYTFANWNTKADGTGTTYNEGDVITVDESTKGQMTLYAQWVPNSYTVNFNKQGGTDGSDNVIATFDAAMPQIATPTRSGYGFYGYFSEPNGNGTRYYDIYGTSTHAWDVAEDNVTLYACWGTPVSYIDADGSLKYVGQYEPLTNGTTTLSRGWYLVTGTVTTNTLVCEGDVKIILADGAKLTATGDYDDAGIRVSAEGASLTIYGQQNQTGQLIATGYFYCAGIGGAKEGSGHDITINGGVITANGGPFGSGIGGGNLGTGHNITINGGTVTATGGKMAAGIGGGNLGTGHNITINGGTVTANGGEMSFGIGGGNWGTGHDITINGGVITAVGGTDASAIGGRFISSNIFVHSSLVLYAGNTNPPTDFIAHTNGVDVSDRLSGKQYVIARKQEESITITFDMQGGTGGTEQITMNEFTEMPDISVPERDGYAFVGYFSGENGTGTKYYTADGTSAHYLDFNTNKTLYAYWDLHVPYIDADGYDQIANNVTKITNTSSTLNAGWYVVNGEVSTAGLVCNGAVHLILADGATLTATAETGYAGIEVSDINPDAAITIYGQTAQTGKLIATGASGAAGIGGGSGDVRCNGQNITINGGIIAAKSLREGAGIGGGKKGYGRHITINRGVIIAESQHFGSAIGGGLGGSDIHIADNLLVRAGESETSTEIIPHGSEDMATALAGKLYASIEPGAVVVTHYAENMGANYGTYYNGTHVYEVVTEGVTMYTASLETYGTETWLNLNEIEGNVLPANTPVIVKQEYESTATDYVELKPYAESTAGISVPANNLSGANLPMDAPANCYILSYEQNRLGFCKYAEGSSLAAHEAFLIIQHGAPEFLVMLITVQPSGNITGTRMVVKKKNGDETRFDANNIAIVECTTEKLTNKGTAKATIDGNEVDVNWVQLWEDGPKFAEFNVEGTFEFTQATADPFVWGSNWCTPSKDDDMEHLMTAAKGQTDDKVTCSYTQESGVLGFKFTGLTDGYTGNSVFFPAQAGDSLSGVAGYWSATADGSRAWYMRLYYNYGNWYSSWVSGYQFYKYLVRPVLAMMAQSSVIVTEKDGTVTVFDFDEVQSVTWEPEPLPGSFGTGKANINGVETDVEWIQLWENGPKFAKYNVGVTDGKAESYGGYYAWGGNQDKVDDHNTGSEVLSGDNDTATKLWGYAWRMPTSAELQSLLDNCTVEWTTVNGVNGRKFTGKGDYASNSVFLPAAGYRSGSNVLDQGSYGDYWSSTPSDSARAGLDFTSGDQRVFGYIPNLGFSVRAIYDPQ